MSTLSTNQIVVEYIIKEGDVKKAKDGFDKLTDAEKEAITNANKLNDTLKNTGTEGKKATDQVSGGLNNMGGTATKIGPLIAGAFSVASVMAFGKQVFNVTAEFQKLSAVLKNTLGSGAAASLALENIKEFAKTTPFAVSELTTSFVKLANQGFTPTIDQMRKLGDLASSTGKSFDQLAEAIIDAQVGEFERLKEFGVRAQKAGDQVIFTFKGVETQVQNNNAAIREYLVGLGDYNGVAGAAAAVSETLGGKVNNLGDAWDNFLNKIGTLLEPILKKALNTTSEFMDSINKIFSGGKSDSERFATVELESYKFYQDMVLNYTDDQLDKFLKTRQEKLKAAQDQLKNAQKRVDEGASAFGMVQVDPDAVRELEQLNIEIANYNGEIAATSEQIKMRNDATNKTEEAYANLTKNQKVADDLRIKSLEKQFKLEERRLELITQIRKLEMDSPLGNIGADKALYEAKIQLRKDYAIQGVKFSEDETKLLEAQSKKASKDFADAASKDLMQNKQSLAIKTKDTDDALAAENSAKIKRMKQWSDAYEQEQENQRKKEKKALDEKIEAEKMYYNLAGNAVQELFNIQQQRIQNEITQLGRRYDEEIRLAGDNEQKVMELNQKRQQEEKELRRKAFEAQRQAAIAEVIFRVAPIIAQQIAGVITAPLAIASYATAAAQIAFIAAQPVPEFKEGTKGKPFKGGKAIVGEIGKEWVVTTSGAVYETPGVATLVDLPKGSQVIPHNEVIKSERFMGSKLMNQGRGESGTGQLVERLISIENTLSKLPITSLTMDERGFTKKIQTKSRETRILNNRFGN